MHAGRFGGRTAIVCACVTGMRSSQIEDVFKELRTHLLRVYTSLTACSLLVLLLLASFRKRMQCLHDKLHCNCPIYKRGCVDCC